MSPSKRLEDKVAVITGASSGLGRAIALAFHREGAQVIVADLQESVDGKVSTAKAISLNGGRARFVRTDATSHFDMENLIRRTVSEFGRVDIYINNAGVPGDLLHPRPIWQADVETWDETFAVNARGVMLGCKYAAAQMIKQDPHPSGDRGWIINIADAYGLHGKQSTAIYSASKHAVVGLTKSVALDCAPFRVHCNAICPGYLRTPMTETIFTDDRNYPFRGLGLPDDVAKVAVFLASEDNTWMTGSAVEVDGGYNAL
ncbi:uncharacterized protein K452DRAFT_330156 [Aplosporella prunicola CBS 121167]|uniref:Uncharacterized protein n=1 Tax=Aplosporella prunicola CBS 121167 TaxID=1176127 RepID=A0A6A6AX56_9PEZI|nr:uncharacterized protein K452DRAFT_330156 [Aplosporella prunicola CBS 121167]KAF2135565.1 hypothetical protein K452DRAFT_330156 [Aplosporella prunicola CBS 121167]